jgi:diguanylate cyclase (GGDEF)-like protein
MLACALATCRALVLGPAHIVEKLKAVLTEETDPALVRARQSSETLVALVRLSIILLLVIATLIVMRIDRTLRTPDLVMSAAALAYGFGLLVVQRRVQGGWLPWLVSLIDVSFASTCLVMLVAQGKPMAALNNRVAFEMYFIAVTISALRFDWRLVAATTALTVAQYMGITAYVFLHWDNVLSLQSNTHGSIVPVQHVNRVMMLVGNGIAAIAVARWARHLRLMVGTDQLTGLLQRRPFLERIDEELARADVARTNLSIAIFDVDGFKQYNDQFGHQEGDRALVRIAEQLKLGVRTTDLLARYGGEEFVIAFPRLDVQLAARRVEALRAAIESTQLQVGQALTISAGVASWPADGKDFDAVLKRADERLYAAKASGRNVVIGPFPMPLRSAVGEGGMKTP